jgi:hypothetical protein
MGHAAKRQKQAIAAASEVANRLGIEADEAHVIKDSNNTIVHLAPAPLVAKVGTSTLRADTLQTLGKELDVAIYLTERGAPIVPPANDVPPGPHLSDGLTITLWCYVEANPSLEVSSETLGDMLSAFHRAFADYPNTLPDFTENLVRVHSALDDRNSTPALSDPDRTFLMEVAATLHETLSKAQVARHALHGDPHLDGNILLTASGPLLVDFEAACYGPYEWDLTSLEQAAVAYRSIDRELLALLSRLRSLAVSTWCWRQYGRAPEVDEAAHVHLGFLREGSS